MPGEPGSFAPPVTVNPGDPSRAIAFVSTEFGPALASVDPNDNFISFFVLRSTGFVKVGSLATGPSPRRSSQPTWTATAHRSDRPQRRRRNDLGVPRRRRRLVPPAASSCRSGSAPRTSRSPISSRMAGSTSSTPTVISGEVGVLENLGGGTSLPPSSIAPGPGRTGSPGRLAHRRSRAGGNHERCRRDIDDRRRPSICRAQPRVGYAWACSRGLGDGRFSNPTYIPTPTAGLVVRAIDFNGDGQTGLAVLTPQGL